MRQAAKSVEIAELAVRHRDEGVVGFDIAGPEAGYPPTRHLDAFNLIAHENFHFTIHAGEGFGLPSIWEALQWCGAERLGHGVRIVDDITVRPDGRVALGRLASYVRDRRVPLEMCPTSNVHTGAAPSIEEHPIDLLRRLRFRVTVNTDNRLMSGISLSSEFATLASGVRHRPRRHGVVDAQRHEVRVLALRRPAADHQRADQAGLRVAPRRSRPQPTSRPPELLAATQPNANSSAAADGAISGWRPIPNDTTRPRRAAISGTSIATWSANGRTSVLMRTTSSAISSGCSASSASRLVVAQYLRVLLEHFGDAQPCRRAAGLCLPLNTT